MLWNNPQDAGISEIFKAAEIFLTACSKPIRHYFHLLSFWIFVTQHGWKDQTAFQLGKLNCPQTGGGKKIASTDYFINKHHNKTSDSLGLSGTKTKSKRSWQLQQTNSRTL